jgi:diguanylate cyclase (GGDEF)-like protein
MSGLITYWLASRLQHFISAPILRLVETSRRVSSTKDYSLRAAEAGEDEVGLLVSAYNEMLEQIQVRDRALEETQSRLDETIQTRTAELVTAVADLRGEISQRKIAEERIRYMAYFDNLTGLPNRQYLSERLDEALREARRDDSLLALLFIDLDHFKEINDSFGHSTGDMLLGSVAQRLTECVRSSDDVTTLNSETRDETVLHTVSRQGGDEFTILLTQVANSFDACRVATRILTAMKEPFSLNRRDVVVGASIGIAVFPHDGDDTDVLLKHADTAMYHAKKSGRNDYACFSESMKEEALRKLTLEGDLRKAIERKEFELYYQPKIDSQTDRVCGLEVLIRWRHPERGMVSPVEFIPVAEETGLIVPIGEWVLRVACSQTRTWHNSGVHNLPISVNVSSRQFRKNALMETVTEILAESGMAPRQLELEVTETTMLQDEDEAVTALLRLKELGIQVALDDFGTGYSSLSYVRRLPLDTIKIDRSFVKELGQDSESASIVTAIIAMAHSLGLRVVAEGVETEQQADFLRSQGCEELQGFLYSEPVPAAAIPALLKDDKKLRRIQAQ